jgi:hypothetical protein
MEGFKDLLNNAKGGDRIDFIVWKSFIFADGSLEIIFDGELR